MPEQVKQIAKQAPHWAALVLVVGAFLWYLDRSTHTDDLVAKQRIDQCHAVQAQTNMIMQQLSDRLAAGAVEDARLTDAIMDFEETLEEHTRAVEKMIDKLGNER